MLRKALAATACAAVGIVIGATAFSLASPRGHAATPTTVHVIEHAITDTVVYPGAHTDTTGNLLTFHNPVYGPLDRTRVGHDRGDCIRIAPAQGTWECRWVTWVTGGKITVEGPFNDTSNTVLAITGGTGIYRNARGQMVLKSRSGGTEYDFIFHLS